MYRFFIKLITITLIFIFFIFLWKVSQAQAQCFFSGSQCSCTEYCGQGFFCRQDNTSCSASFYCYNGHTASYGEYYYNHGFNGCFKVDNWNPPSGACGVTTPRLGACSVNSCGAQCDATHACTNGGTCQSDCQCSIPCETQANGTCIDYSHGQSCGGGTGPSSGGTLGCTGTAPTCCTANCTSGTTSCSACGGGLGYNQCGTVNNSQTCYHNSGSSYCAQTSFNNSCSYFQNNCDGSQGYSCQNGNSCQRTCTTGAVNCSACGRGSQPTNTCNLNGSNPGTQTCQHNQWYGQNGCNYQNFTNGCTYSYNNCSGAYTCNNGNSCQTRISGNIWKDYNHDTGWNNGEPSFQGVTVHLSNGANTTTDGNGYYQFNGLTQGNYTVSITVPGGYTNTNPTSQGVSAGATLGTPPANINFGLTPLYTITGQVYDDVNINKFYDAGVDTIHNGDSVTITGNGYNQTISAGTFSTGQNLLSGEYHIVYNGPTTGWKIVYPGPPAELYIRVGLPGSSDVNHVCSNENYHDASCDGSGNISGANIGVTNENSWVQGTCSDLRIDGTITNNGTTSTGFVDPIPQAPGSGVTCGGNSSAYATTTGTVPLPGGSLACSTPGVVFSGASVPNYGNGQASSDPYNWTLGGSAPLTESFTPVNPTIIRTSYTYMTTTAQESGIDLTTPAHNIASFCSGGLNNCTLASSFPDNVYLVNSGFTLNSYSFPANKNFVILVNGDLHIQGNIIVPVGSTATFSVAGNIYIDPSVGTTPADTTPDVEGIFSTDKSFIIQSSNTYGNACNADGSPKDLRLNLQGSVVTDAENTGGNFVNQRDLCASDLACPTYQVTQRPDFLLNAPSFIKHKNFVWQEQAP